MIEHLGWDGRGGWERETVYEMYPTKNTWFKSQTFISCFIFIYCLSNRRICIVSIRCLIHVQLEKECDESFSMIRNVLWCIYYFENQFQYNVLSCIFQFYDLICYGYMIVCKMWKIFLMFTWLFYRCTGLRNVLCIIWVSLKRTYSRGKDVSILFATHWEVLKSGMNKIICMGVKRWYYPCVNNLSNLQFFFCNRRKDVGALSILCAGGKFPFHSQTWNVAFSLFSCWTRGRKPRATEVKWGCS